MMMMEMTKVINRRSKFSTPGDSDGHACQAGETRKPVDGQMGDFSKPGEGEENVWSGHYDEDDYCDVVDDDMMVTCKWIDG